MWGGIEFMERRIGMHLRRLPCFRVFWGVGRDAMGGKLWAIRFALLDSLD